MRTQDGFDARSFSALCRTLENISSFVFNAERVFAALFSHTAFFDLTEDFGTVHCDIYNVSIPGPNRSSSRMPRRFHLFLIYFAPCSISIDIFQGLVVVFNLYQALYFSLIYSPMYSVCLL